MWRLAGHLIAVSNQQRAGLRQAVADRRRRENTARAHDQADRDAIVAVKLAEKTQERTRQTIIRKLERVGAATRRELHRACSSAFQRDFPAVFDWMLDQGLLVVEGGEGNATRYRLDG